MAGQQDFINRLGKMARHFGKWARRQGITCYRIYDADLPDYPLAIDRYGEHVHVAEYRREDRDPEAEQAWREETVAALALELGVPAQRIHFKERAPQKGAAQYIRQGEAGREFTVEEGGLQFLVNLDDYLDTGLFLDHRQTRAMVRERAQGKRLLNLFAYTGSFSVYAAAGGARETLTMDLSNTYLDWAQRNMALNGFIGPEHRYERADVQEWLRDRPRGVWDLIVLDPPTFSNSKAMRDILDVQRDHPALLEGCLMRLAEGGVIFFSTNLRNFRLRTEELPHWAEVRDISAQTVPPDFRNKRIHRCFVVGRKV